MGTVDKGRACASKKAVFAVLRLHRLKGGDVLYIGLLTHSGELLLYSAA